VERWQKWGLGIAVAGLGVGAAVVLSRQAPEDGAQQLPPLIPRSPQLVPGDVVLLVGDSIGVGIAPPLKTILAQHGVILVSYAHQGDAAAATAAILQDRGVPDRQRIVLTSLGSNDAAGNKPEPLSSLKQIRDQAVTADGPIASATYLPLWWLQPPSFLVPKDKVPAPATWQKQALFRAAVMDAKFDGPGIAPSPAVLAQLGADRIHLSPLGYKLYAQEIASNMSFDVLVQLLQRLLGGFFSETRMDRKSRKCYLLVHVRPLRPRPR
jgi:hypothetical protein